MKIIECEQGTEEWFNARKGIPSASCFNEIITPTTMKPSKSQTKYINALIAESIQDEHGGEGVSTAAMEYGLRVEAEARDFYTLQTGLEVTQVGFCLHDNGRFGGSPDGLVECPTPPGPGGLELKCPLPKTHIGYLRAGMLPTEYRCQVHGLMLVTGRTWWDFMSYAKGLPSFLIRVTPDDFTWALNEEIINFCNKYEQEKAKILGAQL